MIIALVTVRLRETHREALLSHFISLDAEDRRLRFGSNISDDGLGEYAARIDFGRDGLFAVRDDKGRLLAVMHVAFGEKSAELGLSVLPDWRGNGMGSALFRRAVTHLRNRGVREVFVHCLTENGAMMHIARKYRMRIIPAGMETDARLVLDPPNARSRLSEWLHDNHPIKLKAARELFSVVAPQFSR
jgi:GNAT superfamily N-acetyltransferase